MIIALFADETAYDPVARRLEERGHACVRASGSVPGQVDCAIVVGDGGADAGLVEAAEGSGLQVLHLAAGTAAQAAAAAAWGLRLADERYIEAARSEGRAQRSEESRLLLAERRARELASANELLEAQANELRQALGSLDAANRLLTEELNLASELQMSLLPRSYPVDAPIEFAHKFMPLQSIGGDFFDVTPLSGHRLGLVIADVSGHGVGPALVAAMFKGAFSLESRVEESPAALMAALNMQMGAALTTGHYITAFTAIIDTETLEMRYCSAGHPKQLLVKADGRALELSTMGFFLGMGENVEYEEKSLSLEGGDALVLFTDGLFESPDASGRQFGREGILRSVASRLGSSSAELSSGIFSDLLDWTRGVESTDDVTLLVAQVIESL
jgi:phosphoserine phosphatase RsbU/P